MFKCVKLSEIVGVKAYYTMIYVDQIVSGKLAKMIKMINKKKTNDWTYKKMRL